MKNLILTATLLLFSGFAVAGDNYLQLSSAVDQAEDTFVAELVDANKGINYNVTDGHVTIKKAGVYFVVFAPQTSLRAECGNYWVNKNGAPLANSNIRVCQTAAGQTTVVVAQAIVELAKGDVLTFEMSGTLGTNATNPDNEPLIPSAIISVFKL